MNYSFPLVSKISFALQEKLPGFVFSHSFSSSKNELFINFKKGVSGFGIRLLWAHRHCYIFFQETCFAAPTPHYKQFVQLNDKKIIFIRQHSFNRSFQIDFENNYSLVFKMYDGLSNVILFGHEKFISQFRTNILNDKNLVIAGFNKDQSFAKTSEKTEMNDVNLNLESITKINREKVSESEFDLLQTKLITEKNLSKKKLLKEISQTRNRLKEIENAVPENVIANLLLSNLTTIKNGQESAELFDYTTNKTITVKLKKNLTVQQNIEYYFSVFKNRIDKIKVVLTKLNSLDEALKVIENELEQIEKIISIKELMKFEKQKIGTAIAPKLFREFEFDGFKIFVGKNSANNDLLTLKHAHKNDLWLHVKDGGGSHVVLKHKDEKPFPKNVIAHAAAIAAAFSKSKSSSLIPVVYTEKKFVRKPKGGKPGEVIVEKEKVMLVDSI